MMLISLDILPVTRSNNFYKLPDIGPEPMIGVAVH